MAGVEMVQQAAERIRAVAGEAPSGAIVLGSGLGGLLDAWRQVAKFGPEDLPGYPRSTVPGHTGRLVLARWRAGTGLVFQGRVHLYEGRSVAEVLYAVRLAAAAGCRWLLLTNAAGAVDPRYAPGTVVVVEDQIRLLLGGRVLRRAPGAAPATIRPWCGSPFDPRRTEQLLSVLSQEGLRAVRGVLCGGLGPAYETAAEVEMIRRLGGHVACMSTVLEAEEGARLGLEVAALSLVTNLATGLSGQRLDHADVVAMAHQVGPRLAAGLARLIDGWGSDAPAVPASVRT